ncbi:MAG: hypothetical protein CVU44_03215 [Chloroflexi bacterium HGW-Chloroflexi-6]|nr:MAG: hypothetical protein CVU44_03215 [Chloroflexi bacterium HGW-Chloroflexi-6]
MTCDVCGQDKEGRHFEIVTGKLLKSNLKQEGNLVSGTQTYGDFAPMEVAFCRDCWEANLRASLKNRLIGLSITFGLGLLVFIIGEVARLDDMCTGLGFIAAVLGLVGLLYNGFQAWTANYSMIIMKTANDQEFIGSFDDVFDPLIIKVRGSGTDILYWTRETWQKLMDHKPNPDGRTFQTKPERYVKS